MIGRILADRYRLVEQIGVGGMAIVYRAQDLRTGHSVAVKLLKPEFNRDAEFVSRFQREAEAASKMTHHNIVNLLDVGMDGENRYLIMEHVQGKTLKEVIRQKGRLNPTVAAQVTIRILSALQHAHQNGIIHRDIKPQNILVHADGHIKVADFGIARMANSSTLTRGDSVMGSVHYFSPEQASGQATDVTSDIYSVGVTLYEMLTGHVPFEGDTQVAIAMQHLHSQPTPIEAYAPDVPPAIRHVCLMAMEKNPRYRYQSAREMAAELRMALEGRTNEMQPRLAQVQPASAPRQGVSYNTSGEHPGVRIAPRRAARQPKANLRWWLVTLLVTAVVFYGLYVGGMAIYEKLVNSVVVTDYIGADVDSATREIQRSGLKVEVVEINHPTIAEGVVVLQTPLEGETLSKGDTLVLTVSKGPTAMAMPQLVGSSLQDAMKVVQSYGMTLTLVERVVSPTVRADYIITQIPEAGTACKKGDVVQVTVSGGVNYVPDVMGEDFNDAIGHIALSGLTMNPNIQYLDTDTASQHNKVAAQSPAGDTAVIQGTQVTISVYRVQSMLHRQRIALDLPESDSLVNVRVTLTSTATSAAANQVEYTVYKADYPANSARKTEIELVNPTAGEYVYRVYFNEVFAYSGTVVLP